MKLVTNLVNFRDEDCGCIIPVKEYTTERIKGLSSLKRIYKDNISENDAFSDCLSIEKDIEGLWFSSGIREYLENDKKEVEEWLRYYFQANDVYAILGFMAKRLETWS